MHVAVFLSLATTLVSAMHLSRFDLNLDEINTTLENLLKNLSQKDQEKQVLQVKGCKPEDFCRAYNILSNITHQEFGHRGKIVRMLRVNIKHMLQGEKCSKLDESKDTVELQAMLRHLQRCVHHKQSIISSEPPAGAPAAVSRQREPQLQ